jgi:hypothetical protein
MDPGFTPCGYIANLLNRQPFNFNCTLRPRTKITIAYDESDGSFEVRGTWMSFYERVPDRNPITQSIMRYLSMRRSWFLYVWFALVRLIFQSFTPCPLCRTAKIERTS